MKKFLAFAVAGFALLGLAACSDGGGDSTTTQSIQPEPDQATPVDPNAAPEGGDTMDQGTTTTQ